MNEQYKTVFAQKVIQNNFDYLKRRFLDAENGYVFNYPPRVVDIHLGYRGRACQNKCVFCYDSKAGFVRTEEKYESSQIEQLGIELDRAIEWETNGYKIEEVHLAGGGEPTLYPRVAKRILEKFADAGRNVWLVSNGLRIPEPLFTSVATNARGVLISLVGADKNSYLQTARNDGFDKAMQTIQNLVEAKKTNNSSVEIDVTHVFNDLSIPSLESLVLRLNSLGVDEFRLRYDLFSSPTDTINIIGKQEIERILHKYPNLRMKIMLKSPPDERLLDNFICSSPFIWPTWNPLHGLFPCAHVTEEQYRINSKLTNGIYSLVDITADPKTATQQNCHRRCPSSIHWFNLFLNEYNNTDCPELSIITKQ